MRLGRALSKLLSYHFLVPKEIREFGGAITTHLAVYGYFVTTSTLTSQAKDEVNSDRRIRLIDGPKLEELLRQSPHAHRAGLSGYSQTN